MSIIIIVTKVRSRCRRLFARYAQILIGRLPDKNTKAFIRHNLQVWSDSRASAQGEVLFELNSGASSVIAYSYMAAALQKKHKSKIIAYSLTSTIRLPFYRYQLERIIEIFLPKLEKKLFASFGAKSVFKVEPNKQQRSRAAKLFHWIYPTITDKRDLESLVIEGVRVGDLFYDTYLRQNSLPTIDLSDQRFLDFLKKSIGIFVFWQDYFSKHDVRAINVSHCVYENAIPLRIAVLKNIEVYQSNATDVYRMSKKNLFAYGDFIYFPEMFKRLPLHLQTAGRNAARERIELRFSGQVGVDMRYSKKSAFGPKSSSRILRPSDRFKVLIAAHCFFDSPHSYGDNLFPDFYEWFDFIGKISNETDYDWYVKTHPDYLPENTEVINYFLNKYPKLTLLDAGASHLQLIEEGIACVLTTYGTIGFEYAALGILVVNASLCNPHVAYDFNLHPRSIKEYENVLRHLDKQSLVINENEIWEYYFMKNIYNNNNWLFQNHQEMIDNLGGYQEQFKSKGYHYFLSNFSRNKHAQTLVSLENYIESEDFRLCAEHLKIRN